MQVIATISGGAPPRRVLCTGLGGGGSYATLAAVWAATNYPLAQIRLITFGAPAVSAMCTWLHKCMQVVDDAQQLTAIEYEALSLCKGGLLLLFCIHSRVLY